MKICLDIRVGTKGGTSTFIDNFVSELDHAHHDHDIHYVFNAGATPLNGHHARLAAVPYNNRILEFQWSQWQLSRILAKQGFDLYHSLKHVGPLRCRSKTVYRVPAVGQFLGNYPMNRLDHIYWNHVAGLAYRSADMLIAVSQYVAAGLTERLGIPAERIVTVHNGVDPRFRRLEPREREAWDTRSWGIPGDYILCVGNLVPVKNFATAIKAYAMLHARDARLPHLVLAGGQRHPHYRELVELVGRHRLQDRVRFIGYQSGEELVRLYNGAMMLVHPSLHEGFSFTILEAMACGLPIVAAASTSIPEAAGDAALYHHDPQNAEALAERMRKLVEDEALRDRLSQLAWQRSREFTWQRCVNKTIEAYQRLA